MEDAMILNKQSVERGFGDAFILKSMVVDLADQSAPGDRKCFGALHQDARVVKEYLDPDGMPKVGSYISRYAERERGGRRKKISMCVSD